MKPLPDTLPKSFLHGPDATGRPRKVVGSSAGLEKHKAGRPDRAGLHS